MDVGFLVCQFGGDTCLILSVLVVVAAYRGKGIGSELLKTVIMHSWDAGLKRIELEVFTTNTVAVNLYKKNGFELEGTKRNARYLDGRYEDVHFHGAMSNVKI